MPDEDFKRSDGMIQARDTYRLLRAARRGAVPDIEHGTYSPVLWGLGRADPPFARISRIPETSAPGSWRGRASALPGILLIIKDLGGLGLRVFPDYRTKRILANLVSSAVRDFAEQSQFAVTPDWTPRISKQSEFGAG